MKKLAEQLTIDTQFSSAALLPLGLLIGIFCALFM